MAEGSVQLGAGSTEGECAHHVSTSTLPCPHPEGPVSSALRTMGQRAESWERLRDHRGGRREGRSGYERDRRQMLQRACQKQWHGMTWSKTQGGKGWRWGRSGACTRPLEALTASTPGQAGPASGSSSSSPHYKWAGPTAVLSRSWDREELQVSGLLHTGFPSAEQGAASPTAAIFLPCLFQG